MTLEIAPMDGNPAIFVEILQFADLSYLCPGPRIIAFFKKRNVTSFGWAFFAKELSSEQREFLDKYNAYVAQSDELKGYFVMLPQVNNETALICFLKNTGDTNEYLA